MNWIKNKLREWLGITDIEKEIETVKIVNSRFNNQIQGLFELNDKLFRLNDNIDNENYIKSLIEEAKVLSEEHGSKDCRAFAKEVYDYLTKDN